MEINKNTLKEFRKEFDEAILTVAKKYEVQINTGAIRFDTTSFKFNIEVINAEDTEQAQQMQFEKYCSAYGLNKDDYKKEINYDGKTFTLVGFKPQSTKYALVALLNGKRYVLPMRCLL